MAALLISAAALAFAATQNWQIGTKYNITFSNADVSGIFKTFKGAIAFDEKNLDASKFDVSIDVASINTGNGLQNQHAKSAEWFDAAKYPVITFKSKKIIKAGAAYQVTGDLTIHGVTKEISFPFTFQNKGASGVFAASFTVNRLDYHIGKAGDVADALKLSISVPVDKK